MSYKVKRSYTLLPDSFTEVTATPLVLSINAEWERVVLQVSEPTRPAVFCTVEVTELAPNP